MRVVVTGASNPTGEAIVHALLAAGHQVRLFGGEPDVLDRFEGEGAVDWYPGDLKVGGSIEPVLSERQVLIHAANLDVYHTRPTDKHAAAVAIERGTLYARFGAEREQIDLFVCVAPPTGRSDKWRKVQGEALKHVQGTRGAVAHHIVQATGDAASTASQVMSLISGADLLGKQPGRENDAVTA